MTHSSAPEPNPQQSQNQPPEQTQDVHIGRDFHVEGQAHQVDFSQTHIDTQIIRIAVEDIKRQPLNRNSPYKGLKKFEADDKDCFFGREPLIQKLLEDLQQQRLILLLGASGSGKSSVIQAGLIPKLREQWGASFIELTVKPDRDPFMGLFVALVQRGFSQAEAETVLAGTPETLVQMVSALKKPQTPWLLYVDQFEELFTLSNPQKREAFIQSLVRLYQGLEQSQDQSMKLVMTMRTDFLDSVSAYPSLNSTTEGHLRLLDKMDDHQLKLAIAQPAAQHGVVFEADLVEEIIDDLCDQPGALPLLQYSLDLLWHRENLEDRILHIHTYRALGGVQGALQKHVDEIYSELTPDEQEHVKRIFIRLVDISGASKEPDVLGKAVRRRAHFSDFRGELIQTVLTKLINANLLVSNRSTLALGDRPDPANPDLSTIEVAHETLFSSWPTLRRWIEDSKEVILLKNRLKDDAARWKHLCQGDPESAEGELWRGKNLQRLLDLNQEHLFDLWYGGLDEDEQQFITASQELRDRAQQEKEKQLKREKESDRRIVVGAIATGIFAVTALGLGLLVTLGSIQRKQVQAIAVGALVSRSQLLYENHNQLEAMIASVRALRELKELGISDPAILDQLQSILYSIQEQNRLEGHQGIVSSLDFSSNGKTIASAGDDKTVKLWNSNEHQPKTLNHQGIVWDVKFSHNSQFLASSDWGGKVKLWTAGGEWIRDLEADGTREFYGLSFSPDDQTLSAATREGRIIFWDINSGQVMRTLKDPDQYPQATTERIPLYSIAYHPTDGALLASSGDHNDYGIKLWNLNASGDSDPITLGQHKDIVYFVTFSPNGELIASGGKDNLIKLWRVLDRQLVGVIKVQEKTIYSASFSPDNKWLVSGDSGAQVNLWQVQQALDKWRKDQSFLDTSSETFEGHKLAVGRVVFNPTVPKIIASASDDATLRIWQIHTENTALKPVNSDRVNALLSYGCHFLSNYLTSHKNSLSEVDIQLCEDD